MHRIIREVVKKVGGVEQDGNTILFVCAMCLLNPPIGVIWWVEGGVVS